MVSAGSPEGISRGLVGLTAYDYWFADRQTWMADIAEWTVSRKLPLLVIAPTSFRLSWDELEEAATGDERDPDELLAFAIGTADLLLPAAFAVALAESGAVLPFAGAVLGLLAACPRLSWKMHNGGGAGLPPITTGVFGGWAIASVGVVA